MEVECAEEGGEGRGRDVGMKLLVEMVWEGCGDCGGGGGVVGDATGAEAGTWVLAVLDMVRRFRIETTLMKIKIACYHSGAVWIFLDAMSWFRGRAIGWTARSFSTLFCIPGMRCGCFEQHLCSGRAASINGG